MPSTVTVPSHVQLGSHEAHVIHSTQTAFKYLYGLVPIAAGADKFTHLLADWTQYLNPLALQIVPLTAGGFMRIVGVIEILAGILVFVKPRIGGLVVGAWLLAIALQLLVGWMYVDIAVRDIGLAVGAFALARLSGLTNGHAAHVPART